MFVIAIILSVITVTSLGMLWFSPLMFGRDWVELSGTMSTDSKKGMKKTMTIHTLLSLVTGTVIASMLRAGFSIGDLFAIWSAFALPIFVNEVIWDDKSLKYFMIKAGYSITALAIGSAVIYLVI